MCPPSSFAGADPALGREELRQGIRDAVAAGWARLQEGGSAIDAVEAAVCAMEDNPRFNAGRGSVLTTDGTVEMDASIMEGDTLKNGAVACVTNMRHPIALARRILDTDRHSLYVGEGAMTRARALGIPFCDADELITDEQRKRLESAIGGTVGAVALDRRGRVGDSPLIGCGTYAESTSGGVSCTGDGEALIRTVLARRTIDILKMAGDPMHACQIAMDILVEEGRGGGGLICIDWKGRLGWAHSTPLMPVGFMTPGHDLPVVTF